MSRRNSAFFLVVRASANLCASFVVHPLLSRHVTRTDPVARFVWKVLYICSTWVIYLFFFFQVYIFQVWVCVSFSLIIILSLSLARSLSLALSSVHSSSCARALHACDLIPLASNSKFLARAIRLDSGGDRIVSSHHKWRWRTWTAELVATIRICNVTYMSY